MNARNITPTEPAALESGNIHADGVAHKEGENSGESTINSTRPLTRLRGLTRAFAAALAIMVGWTLLAAAPAQADVIGSNGGVASEFVTCNARNHTVSLNMSARGNDPAYWALSDNLFGDSPLPVMVQFKYYDLAARRWSAWSDWTPLARGTTVWTYAQPAGSQKYWYFSYGFLTSAGVWNVRSEYAKGWGSYGWYDVAGGAYNYMSDTVCRT